MPFFNLLGMVTLLRGRGCLYRRKKRPKCSDIRFFCLLVSALIYEIDLEILQYRVLWLCLGDGRAEVLDLLD